MRVVQIERWDVNLLRSTAYHKLPGIRAEEDVNPFSVTVKIK